MAPVIICLILLLAVSVGWQYIATRRDARRYPPPGRLVDIGGYRLHLRCEGRRDGHTPTIVLEAGATNWSSFWSLVQPEVARFARVCSYDRAGLGWSQPSPYPRTSRQIAEELHSLLQHAGIAGPYILAGHSLGGWHVRMFTHLYPNEVAGLVLVDASHEDQAATAPADEAQRIARQFEIARWLAPFGAVRLAGALGLSHELERMLDKLPLAERALTRAVYYRASYWQAAVRETAARDESAGQLRSTEAFGNLPLIVLSATGEIRDEATRRNWLEKQAALTKLSAEGRQIVTEQSGHYIQLDQPALVIEAIRQTATGLPPGFAADHSRL